MKGLNDLDFPINSNESVHNVPNIITARASTIVFEGVKHSSKKEDIEKLLKDFRENLKFDEARDVWEPKNCINFVFNAIDRVGFGKKIKRPNI